MKLQIFTGILLPLILVAAFLTQSAAADEPSWYPYVLARGNDRAVIKNKPMHERPYRPMHFYGNTIRRNYHRGFAPPLPRDWFRSATVVLRR